MDQWIAFGTLALTLFFFIIGRLRCDVVAVIVLLMNFFVSPSAEMYARLKVK
jgi:hypothetical protein